MFPLGRFGIGYPAPTLTRLKAIPLDSPIITPNSPMIPLKAPPKLVKRLGVDPPPGKIGEQ